MDAPWKAGGEGGGVRIEHSAVVGLLQKEAAIGNHASAIDCRDIDVAVRIDDHGGGMTD